MATTSGQSLEKVVGEAVAQLEREKRLVMEERNALEKEKALMTELHGRQKELVKLNVGGMRFATSRSTLLKDPKSMLAIMFSGRFEVVYDDEGSVFIDRDGTHFKYILNYLRGNEIPFGELGTRVIFELAQEAQYYQVEGLTRILQEKKCKVCPATLLGASNKGCLGHRAGRSCSCQGGRNCKACGQHRCSDVCVACELCTECTKLRGGCAPHTWM